MTSRIEPISADLAEPLKSRMAKIFPPELPSPNLYRGVARNESLFIDMIDAGIIGPTGLMDRGTISARTREMLILRTCMRTGNTYEFHLHVRTISQKMGLTTSEISNLKEQQVDQNLWSEQEALLLALTDELVDSTTVSDATFARLSSFYDEADLIEMVQLVGMYTMVAMLVALIQPQPDPY